MHELSAGTSGDFSLVQGGPLFQLLLRAGLVQPTMDLLARRILTITAVAWLPLLVLTIVSGDAFGGSDVPFFEDFAVHARLLVCVPLLVAAEVIVHRRIRVTVKQFIDRGIVLPDAQAAFDGVISSAMRLRNSILAEIVLLAVAFWAGYSFGGRYLTLETATWYAVPEKEGTALTAAGYWYVLVSLLIFRFILLRWYFRLFVWYRFLWQVALRVPLSLNALHPDKAAGLGFLSGSVFAFQPILFAHTCALSGILLGKILYEGAVLTQFKLEIAAWMLFLMLLVLTPLMFFVVRIGAAKRAASREYGIVASNYVAAFRRRWIEAESTPEAELLGSADIQSLADLSNSFAVVQDTSIVPFSRGTVLRLAFITILPLLPLTLTMIPIEELIDRVVSVFV